MSEKKFGSCTRKCRYETKEQAETQGIYVYSCEFCSGYHISSAPKEYWASGMRVNGKLALGMYRK